MKSRITYIVLSLIFLLIHFNSFGQKQKPKNDSSYDDKLLHFGFSLGSNLMDFNITPSNNPINSYPYLTYLNPEVSRLEPGFNIQIITNLRVSKYLDLRFLPGISFGQRTVRFYEVNDSNKVWGDPQKLNPAFLEFPFLLKFKGDRLNNVRPYVISGLDYKYDLAKENDNIKLNRSDFYYDLGAGLDFYLKYFKLSVELKMSNGIYKVFALDSSTSQYGKAIEKMYSQIWVLAFHFE